MGDGSNANRVNGSIHLPSEYIQPKLERCCTSIGRMLLVCWRSCWVLFYGGCVYTWMDPPPSSPPPPESVIPSVDQARDQWIRLVPSNQLNVLCRFCDGRTALRRLEGGGGLVRACRVNVRRTVIANHSTNRPLGYERVYHFVKWQVHPFLFHPLEMKGCTCHFTKWRIHPFISKGTKYYFSGKYEVDNVICILL